VREALGYEAWCLARIRTCRWVITSLDSRIRPSARSAALQVGESPQRARRERAGRSSTSGRRPAASSQNGRAADEQIQRHRSRSPQSSTRAPHAWPRAHRVAAWRRHRRRARRLLPDLGRAPQPPLLLVVGSLSLEVPVDGVYPSGWREDSASPAHPALHAPRHEIPQPLGCVQPEGSPTCSFQCRAARRSRQRTTARHQTVVAPRTSFRRHAERNHRSDPIPHGAQRGELRGKVVGVRCVLLHPHPDRGGNQHNSVVGSLFAALEDATRFDFVSGDLGVATGQVIAELDAGRACRVPGRRPSRDRLVSDRPGSHEGRPGGRG
jgi:hypothetical protein